MTAPRPASVKATPMRALQWNSETAAGAIAVGALLFLVLVAKKFPVVSAA